MRWSGQTVDRGAPDAGALIGLSGLVRTVRTPEFQGLAFHEVMAKTALNRVPAASSMPFEWTINPYRGCSHQCRYCFSRKTHTYLDFDAGDDFDRQIVVKVNAADVVRAEVGRRSWRHDLVALGTNTDPYQRAEGRYELMPGIIRALGESGTPLSILTKGTLLRRDLPLLRQMADHVPVDLALSIAVFDDELQKAIEPGTPTTAARLATVRAAAEQGFDVTVFLMPIMPWLTDQPDHLERAVSEIAASGATRVVFGALHLRPGAREWFLAWIAREHPELERGYRRFYERSSYAPAAYRRQLAARMRPLLRRHGLDPRDDDDQPEVRRAARTATQAQRIPTLAPSPQPTLF